MKLYPKQLLTHSPSPAQSALQALDTKYRPSASDTQSEAAEEGSAATGRVGEGENHSSSSESPGKRGSVKYEPETSGKSTLLGRTDSGSLSGFMDDGNVSQSELSADSGPVRGRQRTGTTLNRSPKRIRDRHDSHKQERGTGDTSSNNKPDFPRSVSMPSTGSSSTLSETEPAAVGQSTLELGPNSIGFEKAGPEGAGDGFEDLTQPQRKETQHSDKGNRAGGSLGNLRKPFLDMLFVSRDSGLDTLQGEGEGQTDQTGPQSAREPSSNHLSAGREDPLDSSFHPSHDHDEFDDSMNGDTGKRRKHSSKEPYHDLEIRNQKLQQEVFELRRQYQAHMSHVQMLQATLETNLTDTNEIKDRLQSTNLFMRNLEPRVRLMEQKLLEIERTKLNQLRDMQKQLSRLQRAQDAETQVGPRSSFTSHASSLLLSSFLTGILILLSPLLWLWNLIRTEVLAKIPRGAKDGGSERSLRRRRGSRLRQDSGRNRRIPTSSRSMDLTRRR